ncbi:mitochondrial coenzyme A diphosphatase NUDT8-like [Anticarsia gemmatalis]|uniref:mitochondrial coenzyme A diphosphatase NUDT8-like n=1 Tax=Anticarsia gemmatalis TaxID=129554 RepID=UPI003F76D59F
MIRSIYKTIMLLTPEALLSTASRERCIANLKELPMFIRDDSYKRSAAVLVPLCVVDGEVCLLFTLRSSTLSTHSGQVSFPGGKMDEGETVYQTAVRETEEEIGVPPKDIDIWSKMSLVQGRDSSIVITPVVGELKNFNENKLQPNESEVAEIFTIPIKVLCDQTNHAGFKFNGNIIPVFMGGKHKVWGITGIITHLFLQCFLPNELYQGDFQRLEYKLEDLMPSKL